MNRVHVDGELGVTTLRGILNGVKPRIPLPKTLRSTSFTSLQGLNAGLGRGRLRSSDLQQPFRGVLVPSMVALTLTELCHARQNTLASHAHFCGVTAAVLTGVPLPRNLENSRTLHVSTTPEHRAPSGRGLRGYALTDAAARDWNGLRVSTPERIWCELAPFLTVPDLVAAGDYLIHWRLPHTTERGLREAAARCGGRRGGPSLRAAAQLLNDRSESPQESRLRVIVVCAGIQGLAVNLPVTTIDGYRYRGDLAFPLRKMIIEYQGWIHFGPDKIQADMTRISRLEADGWYVMQVNARDLDNAAELVARIRRLLAARPWFD